jgi:hypothetical protein
MVLMALLLVALVCLALGLVLASAPWLIASLAASVLAAIVLWRVRGQLVAPGRNAKAGEQEPTDGEIGPDSPIWVIDGRPRYHLRSCPIVAGDDAEQIPYAQAVADGFVACPSCLPKLAERAAGDARPAVGTPADRLGEPVPGGPLAGRADSPAGQVWVVDGRPRYHTADCMIIEGQAKQAIPLTQAIEDGFIPCSLCEPAAGPLS